MHPPARHRARFPQPLHENPPVFVVEEDRLASVAACHDVIKRSRELNSNAARHDLR